MTLATYREKMEARRETRVFTAHEDRCDRCGAEALHAARKNKDDRIMELLWCGHHFLQFGARLLEDGWRVINNDNPAF